MYIYILVKVRHLLQQSIATTDAVHEVRERLLPRKAQTEPADSTAEQQEQRRGSDDCAREAGKWRTRGRGRRVSCCSGLKADLGMLSGQTGKEGRAEKKKEEKKQKK